MKKITYFLIMIAFIISLTSESKCYAPLNRPFGFGIMLGEPTGLTAKLWVANDQALAFSLGNSYLGALRLGADYLFHFNAFRTNVVNLYAGPGVAVGFGESEGWWYVHDEDRFWFKRANDVGFGIRGVFGINIVPRRVPLEIFGEIGVLVGLLPGTHVNAEGAVGIRYYF